MEDKPEGENGAAAAADDDDDAQGPANCLGDWRTIVFGENLLTERRTPSSRPRADQDVTGDGRAVVEIAGHMDVTLRA